LKERSEITLPESSTSAPGSCVIGLIDPKTPTNVGAVLRAAGCYQAQAVRYTGERFGHAVRFHTDTKGFNAKIPLLQVDDMFSALPQGMQIVCVELAEGAMSLPEFQHPQHALYVFGPEDGSIPQAIIHAADSVVYIPTIGCMNLAATVNVVLYDRLAKSAANHDDDARIRSSRDVNNRLKTRSGDSADHD
jgi:tRNA(Leu) C34 or U34 (ribose-2'-O)-methylase TrmL